jgi:tetratricopeptide (TPR) repeat protein
MYRKALLLLTFMLITATGVFAQDAAAVAPILPKAYRLNIVDGEYQTMNNCGPATLTNGLKYFGYQNDQKRAAAWLKPNPDDKNVTAAQMVEFVNTQVPELPVYALTRSGGSLALLKTLLYNNFPVIIEEGYDPEPDRLGWMSHFLLMIAYDDSVGVFTTHDSYDGMNLNYSYEHIDQFWRHFNRNYIVLYERSREAELLGLLGTDADVWQNHINSLEDARAEAVANPNDAYAWFNMGTNFVALGMFQEASVAFDQALQIGMPWRTLWYQYGPYEAYLQVGRYDNVIELARGILNDGGGQYVEETYYYAALAREGMGEIDRAIDNLRAAVNFNPNFTPAREALDRLTANG